MKYIKAKAKHIIRRCLLEKTNEAEKVNGYAFEINQLLDEAYAHGRADGSENPQGEFLDWLFENYYICDNHMWSVGKEEILEDYKNRRIKK